MGSNVDYVRAVVVDPHGFASRNRDTRTRSVLDGDGASGAIVDDVRLLDGRDDEVIPRSSSARQVEA